MIAGKLRRKLIRDLETRELRGTRADGTDLVWLVNQISEEEQPTGNGKEPSKVPVQVTQRQRWKSWLSIGVPKEDAGRTPRLC